MAFDAAHNYTLLFGGFITTPTYYNDTYAWNGTAWTPVCTGACLAASPTPRWKASMAYDLARSRMVLFGGGDASTVSGQTYEWDGLGWSLKSSSGPVARFDASMAYDKVRKRVVLFGGRDGTGVSALFLQDTWEWDGTTWTPYSASTTPLKRQGHTMAFDSNRQRTFLFGGLSQSIAMADSWDYYTRGGGCSTVAPCDTGFCVDGVCCESIGCGTCQSCSLASSPGICAAVTNADDADTCAGVNTCDLNGQCKKKNGQGCATGSQCASGSCADGVCCSTACAGGCDVCNVSAGNCTVLGAGVTGANPRTVAVPLRRHLG